MKRTRVITVSHHRRVIAEVKAGPGEPGMSFEEYRKAEDERMMRELRDQFIAHFEREQGVVEH